MANQLGYSNVPAYIHTHTQQKMTLSFRKSYNTFSTKFFFFFSYNTLVYIFTKIPLMQNFVLN